MTEYYLLSEILGKLHETVGKLHSAIWNSWQAGSEIPIYVERCKLSYLTT